MGTSPGRFHHPTSCATLDGALVVVDCGNHRLQCFSEARLEPQWAVGTSHTRPLSVASDGVSTIYVLYEGQRLRKFTLTADELEPALAHRSSSRKSTLRL